MLKDYGTLVGSSLNQGPFSGPPYYIGDFKEGA